MSPGDSLAREPAAPRRWLSIVGIGEDGLEGLTAVARGLTSNRPTLSSAKYFLKDVRKSALGQTAVQRHLAAFKSAHAGVAGDGLAPLAPRPEVLPRPEPMPWPTRFFVLLCPSGV